MAARPSSPRSPGVLRGLINFFYHHSQLSVLVLLLLPLLWLLIIYISPLFDLLKQSRYGIDPFTMLVSRESSWGNYEALLEPANLDIIRRTVLMASADSAPDVPLEAATKPALPKLEYRAGEPRWRNPSARNNRSRRSTNRPSKWRMPKT